MPKLDFPLRFLYHTTPKKNDLFEKKIVIFKTGRNIVLLAQ